MTKEVVVEQLESIVGTYKILIGHGINSDILDADDIEAIETAISALKENRPKGYWDTNCQGIVFCSHCKKVFNHNYDIDYMESHFNFCPNCGADMRGKAE